MTIEREDVLLLGLILLMAGAVAYPHVNGFLTEPSDIVKQCREEAKAAEVNSSLAQWDAKCSCIPPDKVNEKQFAVAEKVHRATTLYLIQCRLSEDAPLKSPFTIPVRKITNKSAIDNASSLNTSRTRLLNGSAR